MRQALATSHIMSLDFHPTEHVLVATAGKLLIVWDYGDPAKDPVIMAQFSM